MAILVVPGHETERGMATLTNNIDATFEALRGSDRAALVPYLTAGYPSPEWTLPLLEMLATQGADLIELGVPFSDPIADGPTIQAACKVALDAGTTLAGVLDTLAAFRRRFSTPVVLFGALNPFLRYGLEEFALAASRAGADGVLIPDVPLEESEPIAATLATHRLHLIQLVAPTTPFSRKKLIVERAAGFIYYISVKGVTGARAQARFALVEPLAELRQLCSLPVVVGFGIATSAQAREVARIADGVVVGSALVERVGRSGSLDEALETVSPWFAEMAASVHEARR